MSRLLRFALVPMVALLVLAGCGDEGSGGTRGGERQDAARADDGGRADEGGAKDETADDGHEDPLPPIQVLAPPAFSSVHRSFVLRGTAQVIEGELRWSILDAALEPLASGRMAASCGAPCRGEFSTRVDIRRVPLGSWELHVFAPPVGDDDPPRVHDVILPITVVAKPVDQPAADAPPPGGVPNDL